MSKTKCSHYGVNKKDEAFVIPVVLVFIIITSSLILYQSISLANQLHSLQASINDLSKIETAVNTQRIISELDSSKCSNKINLEYQSSEKHYFNIDVICVFQETEDQQYNANVATLIDPKANNEERVSEFKNLQNNKDIQIISNNQVEMIIDDQPIISKYSNLMYVCLVTYGDQNLRIILVNSNLNIESNQVVK